MLTSIKTKESHHGVALMVALYHNGKVSSTAIHSMRDNVKHTKWMVRVENLAKMMVGSWIFMGWQLLY